MDIDVLGSYNTLKATLPSLLKSAAKNEHDIRTGEQNLKDSLFCCADFPKPPSREQAAESFSLAQLYSIWEFRCKPTSE